MYQSGVIVRAVDAINCNDAGSDAATLTDECVFDWSHIFEPEQALALAVVLSNNIINAISAYASDTCIDENITRDIAAIELSATNSTGSASMKNPIATNTTIAVKSSASTLVDATKAGLMRDDRREGVLWVTDFASAYSTLRIT